MIVTNESDLPRLLESPLPVLVKFHADWCPPCRRFEPVLEELAHELQGRAIIAKVDADENPALTGKMGVDALPSLVFFQDGRETGRLVGIHSREKILLALGLTNLSEAKFSQK